MAAFEMFTILIVLTMYTSCYSIDGNYMDGELFYYTKDDDSQISLPYKSSVNVFNFPVTPTIEPESEWISPEPTNSFTTFSKPPLFPFPHNRPFFPKPTIRNFPVTPTIEPESEWISPQPTNSFTTFSKPPLFPFPHNRPFFPKPTIRPIPITDRYYESLAVQPRTTTTAVANTPDDNDFRRNYSLQILEIPVWILNGYVDYDSKGRDLSDTTNLTTDVATEDDVEEIDAAGTIDIESIQFTDEHGAPCSVERSISDGKPFFLIKCDNNTFNDDVTTTKKTSTNQRKNLDSKSDVTYYVDEIMTINNSEVEPK